MKVFQRVEGTPYFRFLGVSTVVLPLKAYLVVMQGDRLAELYRFQLHMGVPAVVLDADQTPEHLPDFLTAAECAEELREHFRQGQAQPQHA